MVEVIPKKCPFFGKLSVKESPENHKVELDHSFENGDLIKNKHKKCHCIEDWIVHFHITV